MKKTRFIEAQMMGILRQMENGAPISELCREHGMSSATVYKWRAKYGGMDASLISESEPCPPLVRGQWRALWPKGTAGRSACMPMSACET